LATATDDRLHQPQRLAVCEPAAKAHQAALTAGAAAAWLSGSGPTVAAVVDDAHLASVEAALGDTGTVLRPGPDVDGAVVVDS
jgi:homoserine kinase